MTEANTDTGPAIADTSPGNETVTNPTTQTQENANTDTPAFTVPDAYKDKPWASKIKSHDDLYKQIDNLDTLAGKKTITPLDYSKATPEEIMAYHASLAPQDIKSYDFGKDADAEFSGAIGKLFQENGLSKYQGDAVIRAVAELTGKMANAKLEVDVSADGYMELTKKSFGDKAPEAVKMIEGALKKYGSAEDLQFLDKVDNTTRSVIDRVLHKVLSAHGIKETDIGADNGGAVTNDIEATRKDLRQKITDLSKRIHTEQEKRDLTDKLTATYMTK